MWSQEDVSQESAIREGKTQGGQNREGQEKDFYITKGKGFEFHFFDDSYLLQLDFRGQFRASLTDFEKFPDPNEDFPESGTTLKVNRARIKIGGYVFKPYYTFYFEQDLVGGNLLDFRAQLEKLPYLKLRVGQWKVRYSRERVISSGSQQGLDRSIINRVFTIDRQQGVSVYGNIDAGSAANFSYWGSVLTGTGRGGSTVDGNNLMYMLRLQWNPNREVLGWSGSDLKGHQRFVSSVAVAAVTNESRYTSFSTSGGGQLFGFDEGETDQYKIDQLLFETAFKWRGLSWQQEFHLKKIDDRINDTETTLVGNYVQLGYFPHHSISNWPRQLEVFGRHAFYDPDEDNSNDINSEYTFGLNWFFKGHKNKLTLEYSYLEFDQFSPVFESGHRIRLQWDVSIF
jgi:phosphate-selective porin